MTEPVEVMSLLAKKDGKVLLGQRAFTRSRHPGVLSTITMMARVKPFYVPHFIQKMVTERLSDFDNLRGSWKIHEPPIVRWVDDRQGTGISEYTKMVTVELEVMTDWNPQPNRRFYENVGWYDIDLYKKAYNKNEAQLLLPNANPITLCIDGACNEGAMRALNATHTTEE